MRFQRRKVRNPVVASMALMVVGAIAVDRAAAQANDACADAIAVAAGTVSGSTVAFNREDKREIYRCPQIMKKFIYDFDRGVTVQPHLFRVARYITS